MMHSTPMHALAKKKRGGAHVLHARRWGLVVVPAVRAVAMPVAAGEPEEHDAEGVLQATLQYGGNAEGRGAFVR